MKFFDTIKRKINGKRLSIYLFLIFAIRDKLRLFGGIFANLLYIAWNTVLAFIYGDKLLLTTSLYYFLLALMRYLLLISGTRRKESFLIKHSALLVGILLITSDLAMGAVMVYTLARGIKKNYSPPSLIPQSLFSLYCLFGALLRISRHKKEHGELCLGIDAISFAAASFSVFNLLNYLSHIDSFPIDRVVTLAVGLISVTAVFFAAVFLIIRGRRREK